MSKSTVGIQEAAILLGKTERQIRYMIEKQQLLASKVGGRWVVKLKEIQDTPKKASAP